MIDSIPLGEVALVFNGKTPSTAEKRATGHPILKIKDVTEAGEFRGEFNSFVDPGFAEKHKKKAVRKNDVLVLNAAHNADYVGSKMFKASAEVEGAIATGEWLLARAASNLLDESYLWHWFQSPNTRFRIRKRVKGIHLYPRDVGELRVPLPPIDIQRRIAAILDMADCIRRKREQVLALADKFLKSVFLEKFGDPVRNPYGHRQKQLCECAGFISGATPSKNNTSYWHGDFPWVSPKDMKVELISDAEDHVSDLVFIESNLKKVPANMSLIVVRGMILARTVPIAFTAREVAINQDMKAIDFNSEVSPIFGFWCLKVLQQRILNDVDTAAHGTKRINLSRLGAIPIHIPGDKLQREFVAIARKFGKIRNQLETSLIRIKRYVFISFATRVSR